MNEINLTLTKEEMDIVLKGLNSVSSLSDLLTGLPLELKREEKFKVLKEQDLANLLITRIYQLSGQEDEN